MNFSIGVSNFVGEDVPPQLGKHLEEFSCGQIADDRTTDSIEVYVIGPVEPTFIVGGNLRGHRVVCRCTVERDRTRASALEPRHQRAFLDR